jgi:hypothetical protein
MGKHVKLFETYFNIKEVVHGDLSDIKLKIHVPKTEIDFDKFETKLNNVLRLTTQYYKTKCYKNMFICNIKIDANSYRFSTDFFNHMLNELKIHLDFFKLEVDKSDVVDSEINLYLK